MTNSEIREALEDARHILTTLHGLMATDNIGAYGKALSNGCDPNGAWDCFRDTCFKIDETETIAKLDSALAALRQEPKPLAEAKGGWIEGESRRKPILLIQAPWTVTTTKFPLMGLPVIVAITERKP